MKAFPSVTMKPEELNGMDLRDFFAAKAMQAIVSNSNGSMYHEEVAEISYLIAKAMLNEREKP